MDEVKKRDLRADLLAAEAESRAKKRKAAGLPVEDVQLTPAASEDEEAKKRRKVLQEALEMDKDADSDEGDGDGDGSKGNAKCAMGRVAILLELTLTYSGDHGGGEEDGDDDDDDEEDDEEDDTAELLRELEKIKRERAAEQARVEQAEAEATDAEREAQIATANPLLNLAAALGNAPGVNTTAPGTFAVKRRWDDGPYLRIFFHADRDVIVFLHFYRPCFQKSGNK